MSNGQDKSQKRFVYRRKKVCRFCEEKVPHIDFKHVDMLRQYVPERGRVLPRRISGTCSLHQRRLKEAVKRARVLALLPVTADVM